MKKNFFRFLIAVFFVTMILGIVLSTIIGLWLRAYGWQTVQFLVRAPMATRIEYTTSIFTKKPETTILPTRQETTASGSTTPVKELPPTPNSWTIANMSHEYQKLNNCGPASLAMAASVQGVTFSQHEAAEIVKGGGLDRNVSPQEMVAFLNSKNLSAVYRVNGSSETIERLVSQNIPVIVHQWLVRRDDGELVGHYRVVRGYDKAKKIFITNDSFNGANFAIPYAQFDTWWRPFNRGYIPVYSEQQITTVQEILGSDWDEQLNVQHALSQAQHELTNGPKDNYASYNAGTNALLLNQPEQAAKYYDEALSTEFPHHYLWYHYGHLEAYFRVGKYDDVLRLSDELLKAAGEIEEARFWRAKVFIAQDQKNKAIEELEIAVKANPRYAAARELLDELR